MSSFDPKQESNFSPAEYGLDNDSNWVDEDDNIPVIPESYISSSPRKISLNPDTLAMVETAFLASTASLIWLINYYFPLGPVLRVFFPLPIALIYLRRGKRAAWMTCIVAGMLLSVLMGPVRSIVFLLPFGLMGVQLGACWRRKAHWLWSIILGSIIGSLGIFFRLWLFSILLGEDLWVYAINQITQLAEWIFLKLGLLAIPGFWLIQTLAIAMIFLNNLVYLFAVHLVALLMFDRLHNPIPRPPKWIQVILDYE
ncbi:MAG: DUF2232 domain-containing protein [Cyanobacteria bacterium J083]|nr:MAG: DUF2232 domain-containing protein [Cyanobacteria bacterium J083]